MQVRQPVQRAQRTLRAAAQVDAQSLHLLHEIRLGASRLGRGGHTHRTSGALIEENLDAAAGSSGPDTQRTVVPDPMQHALHVLATAQPVGAVIMTLARVDAFAQGADLDDVAAAARRGDPVIAERVVICVDGKYPVDLGAPAPLPARDLVLVGRDPPDRRRRSVSRPPLAPRFSSLSCLGHGGRRCRPHRTPYPTCAAPTLTRPRCRLGNRRTHVAGDLRRPLRPRRLSQRHASCCFGSFGNCAIASTRFLTRRAISSSRHKS